MYKLLMVLGMILLLGLTCVGGYVVYLYASYDRLPDNLGLDVRGSAKPILSTDTEYSALSYNIGFGAYDPEFSFFMDGGTQSRAQSPDTVRRNLAGAVQTLQAYKPDITLLQEVDVHATRSFGIDEYALLQRSFANHAHTMAINYDSAYLFYPLTKPHGKTRAGIVTFSRYDLHSALRRSLPIATDINKFFDLDRCYSRVEIAVNNGKKLYVYNMHATAFGGSQDILQTQMRMLFADMTERYNKGHYVLAGGDFNQSLATPASSFNDPWSDWTPQPFAFELVPPTIRFINNYTNTSVNTLRDSGQAYQKGRTQEGIVDGFFASDNIIGVRVENIEHNYQYSDHNPVLLRFVLDGTGH